jgi:hypothetical protein
MTHLHPLRWQRQIFSDANPASAAVATWAEQVRQHRQALPADHPGRQWERSLSTTVESSLNLMRDLRDQGVVQWTRWMFGPLGLGAVLPPDTPDETLAVARAHGELEAARREVLAHIGEGGFAQAVCRIVLAGMVSIGSFERRSFRLARLLAALPAGRRGGKTEVADWQQLMRDEARVAAVAPVEALNALEQMLPDTASRERALAMAAAVMMIEPTLNHPRSEIIELLIATLDVEPQRVMDLAFELTAPLATQPTPRVAAARRSKTKKR